MSKQTMTAGHTPGPWTHTPMQDTIWDADGNVQIAKVWDLPRDERGKSQWQTEDANARLIAAAPELLAALERIVADWDAKEEVLHFSITKARAAIAKAIGGDQ